MPITTDFLLLYDELKVTPDCSLDHFKRAYRRRVADLHPDRVQGKANPAATSRLQALTRLHDEAMRFHDHHGRLPGANQTAQIAPTETPVRITAHAAPSRSTARSILIAALILAGVVVAWFLLPDEPADNPTEPAHVSLAQTRQPDEGGDFLILGMDEGGVRRIQGEPAFLATDRWEYGPSYVSFERHKVVGWYSSPLYPLKTGAPRRNASKTTD
jgi:curved DNA-binding protein CbpA